MKDLKFIAMKEGGQVLARILEELRARVTPGIETREIDDWTRRLCLKYGVRPSFLGYEGYPSSICVSINDEVVHGIPSKRILKSEDIISLDLGIFHKGFHTDGAITFTLVPASSEITRLLSVTREALLLGIEQAVIGNRVGDIGSAIQNYVEKNNFSVVRSLVGHGVGKNIHEEPLIPNFGSQDSGASLHKGMTIAIEPMVSAGGYEVYQAEDGWTYKTSDKSMVAHFEHTVYITDNLPVVLTKNGS